MGEVPLHAPASSTGCLLEGLGCVCLWVRGSSWSHLGNGFLLLMEIGSTGTMQVKVSISMRAASLELSREGGCACPTSAQLPALAFLRCFPWQSQALSEEKSTLQMVQEGWGLRAAAACRGTSGSMGAMMVLEEGARRGWEPPHLPGGSPLLILQESSSMQKGKDRRAAA